MCQTQTSPSFECDKEYDDLSLSLVLSLSRLIRPLPNQLQSNSYNISDELHDVLQFAVVSTVRTCTIDFEIEFIYVATNYFSRLVYIS